MKKLTKQNIVVKSTYLNHCEDYTMSPIRIKASTASNGSQQINTTEISIIPTVNRYFYVFDTDTDLANGATIPSTLFFDDHGYLITEFTLFSPNGYVNLYINGMIQESGILTITTNFLTFIPQQATIYSGTPIAIESLGFSAK